MFRSTPEIKSIRKSLTIGLSCQFLPLFILGLIASISPQKTLLESLPSSINVLILLYLVGSFFWGYIIFFKATSRYAKYKGYPRYFGWLGIFNILGFCILFILNDRNVVERNDTTENPFYDFSFVSVILGCISILLLYTVLLCFILVCFRGISFTDLESHIDNIEKTKDYGLFVFSSMLLLFGWFWYLLKEIKKSNIDPRLLFGAWRVREIKLPIILAIALFMFVLGTNRTILYILSFIIPKYVYAQVNYEPASIFMEFIRMLLPSSLLPMMMEIFFRGIIFQKLAIKKNIMKGMIFSSLFYAFIFALVGLPHVLFSLFVFGFVMAILYLQSKQLTVPIFSSLVYQILWESRYFYGLFSGDEYFTTAKTVAEYQRHFLDYLPLTILYIAVSAPFLAYFIYKNLPRNYRIEKLPYFANQAASSN